MEAAKPLVLCQVFSGYCKPKGNADTERVIKTVREDLIWSRDWLSFGGLEEALGKCGTEHTPNSSINSHGIPPGWNTSNGSWRRLPANGRLSNWDGCEVGAHYINHEEQYNLYNLMKIIMGS